MSVSLDRYRNIFASTAPALVSSGNELTKMNSSPNPLSHSFKIRKFVRRRRIYDMTTSLRSPLFIWLLGDGFESRVVQAVPIQLHGLNYNTRQGPDWDWNKCKGRAQVMTDLTLLKRMTNRIRLLSLTDCGQGELVMEVAQELGMQVWLGMWVAPEEFVFQGEKAALASLLDRGLVDESIVLGITVGSEAIYREDATVPQMIGYMEEVYQMVQDSGLNLPVTIVDIAPEYNKSPELRSAVNVTFANTFPFWEGIPIEGAVADLQDDLGFLLNLPESRSKPFVLGETGWPSDGFIEDVGIAGPDLQRRYFVETFCRIDVENQWSYYWFTGIDNAWRQLQDPDNTIEGNWGFLYANLTLKPQFQDLTFQCSDGVDYSFAEIDWTVPLFTDAPTALSPASCQAHESCAGLFGNCCPTDFGDFLGCCDPDVATPPSAAPFISTASPLASPVLPPTEAPTMLPTVSPTTEIPSLPPSLSPIPLPPVDINATTVPTVSPTNPAPTISPTPAPTVTPSLRPTSAPTTPIPSQSPTISPRPTELATPKPTVAVIFRPAPASPTEAPIASFMAPTDLPQTTFGEINNGANTSASGSPSSLLGGRGDFSSFLMTAASLAMVLL